MVNIQSSWHQHASIIIVSSLEWLKCLSLVPNIN